MKRWSVIGPLLLLLATPAVAQKKFDRQAAANHFKRGEAQYNSGEYAKAIVEFTKANALAPHPTCLFNIARCHENQGNHSQALEHYRRALTLTTDQASRADIERRIRNIESRPVKVFISSRPPGAEVTVDGRAGPEPSATPLVVALVPGEHVLLFRLAGHQLTARRVDVEMQKEQPVDVTLEPLPAACPPTPPPCPACPAPRKCPQLRLAELYRFKVHISLLGAFYIARDRPFAGGPGIQIHASWKRFIAGVQLTGFPGGQEQQDITIRTDPSGSQDTFNTATYQALFGQAEGGYGFPLRNAYLYATLGLGGSLDQVTYIKDSNTQRVVRAGAFTWSVGGGMEAMVYRWLSVGVALRIGATHGERVDDEAADKVAKSTPVGTVPVVDEGALVSTEPIEPYLMFWGAVTLHL